MLENDRDEGVGKWFELRGCKTVGMRGVGKRLG